MPAAALDLGRGEPRGVPRTVQVVDVEQRRHRRRPTPPSRSDGHARSPPPATRRAGAGPASRGDGRSPRPAAPRRRGRRRPGGRGCARVLTRPRSGSRSRRRPSADRRGVASSSKPTMRSSGSSVDAGGVEHPAPDLDARARWTSSAVAPASAWKKLACFSDTTAPPTRRPLSPSASMSRPAESPGGLREHRARVGPAGLVLAPPAHDLVDRAPRTSAAVAVGDRGTSRRRPRRRRTEAGAAVAEPELGGRRARGPRRPAPRSTTSRVDAARRRSPGRGRRRSSAPRRRRCPGSRRRTRARRARPPAAAPGEHRERHRRRRPAPMPAPRRRGRAARTRRSSTTATPANRRRRRAGSSPARRRAAAARASATTAASAGERRRASRPRTSTATGPPTR